MAVRTARASAGWSVRFSKRATSTRSRSPKKPAALALTRSPGNVTSSQAAETTPQAAKTTSPPNRTLRQVR